MSFIVQIIEISTIECTVNAKITLERAVVKEESIPYFRYYNYLARFW